jgi:outer membrane protein assembly factor BamA
VRATLRAFCASRAFFLALPAALALFCGVCAAQAAAAEKPAGPALKTEGNRAFGARRLAELIALPDPVPDWNREEWAAWSSDAALLVREAYRDKGYFDADAEVVPEFPGAGERAVPLRVVLRVSEGPRYRFGAVRIGLPGPGYPRYDSTDLATRPGRAFDRALLFADRKELLGFYGNAGFLRAQAAESLYYDPVRKAVDVAFRLQPGTALVFDTLVFRIHREGDTTGGAGKTNRRVLRNLLPLDPGDTLSLAELNAYERKLKSTRVFNFVRLRDSATEADPDARARGVLVLAAEERVPGEVEAAGYWETQYGFGVDLSWSHGNLAGRLQEGRLGTTLAQRKQSVLAGYAAPLLFGTLVRFDNELVANWYQDRSLVRDTGWFDGDFDVSNQSKLSRQLAPWLRGVSGAELFGKSERVDSATRARDFNLNFLNSLYLQRLDAWINPTRGARLALTWGNGGPLFDDQRIALHRNRHNWLEAEGAGYVPLGRRAVLALRLDGGRFFGAGGLNSSRFFLGGPRSVRSRGWRSVCPRVNAAGNCEQEGVEPAYALGSAELRITPFSGAAFGVAGHLAGLQVVPFADYGNVWEPGEPLNESGKGRAVGLGLRYGFLALFNIRVDYARDPEDPSVSRWVFDLAQAF